MISKHTRSHRPTSTAKKEPLFPKHKVSFNQRAYPGKKPIITTKAREYQRKYGTDVIVSQIPSS